MPGTSEPAVPFVQTATGLAEILPALQPHDRIAIDTEADSLHSYFEKLCLMQITVPGQDLLVDPLAGFPLEPLWDVLAGSELVIHGADYDLRLMRRVGFTGPRQVFDTMIAARLCGITEFSLAALLLKHFEVTLAKGSQKADWSRRPLPRQMLDYAVNDTRYLLKLADILSAELTRLGRQDWFLQSCQRAIFASTVVKERDPDQLWRITGSHELQGRASAILRALWQWREREAQSVDRPTFHILHNEQLVDAASRFDLGEQVEARVLRGGRRQRFFDAAERGLAETEEQWPERIRGKGRPPRATPQQEERLRHWRLQRDTVAKDLALDPSLIAPKAILEGLAYNEAETLPRLMPWQRELLGAPAPAAPVLQTTGEF